MLCNARTQSKHAASYKTNRVKEIDGNNKGERTIKKRKKEEKHDQTDDEPKKYLLISDPRNIQRTQRLHTRARIEKNKC